MHIHTLSLSHTRGIEHALQKCMFKRAPSNRSISVSTRRCSSSKESSMCATKSLYLALPRCVLSLPGVHTRHEHLRPSGGLHRPQSSDIWSLVSQQSWLTQHPGSLELCPKQIVKQNVREQEQHVDGGCGGGGGGGGGAGCATQAMGPQLHHQPPFRRQHRAATGVPGRPRTR